MSVTEYKTAETRILTWLNRPDNGYSMDRIPDQLSGYKNSKNIADFHCYKFPYSYFIESKATIADRFDFSLITPYQMESLYKKSHIEGEHGYIIILYLDYHRAFLLDIRDIVDLGRKSLNITKLNKWEFPHVEIATVPSRKALKDYTGELDQYSNKLQELREEFYKTYKVINDN